MSNIFHFSLKKLVFLFCILQALLWVYLSFHQKEQKSYFRREISKLKEKHFVQDNFGSTSKIYLKSIKPEKDNQDFSFLQLNDFRDNIQKQFQKLSIPIKQNDLPTTHAEDFFVWNGKVEFQTGYTGLKKVLDLMKKENWQPLDIVVDSSAYSADNPKLSVELFFSFVISKL
jgi:hypothetical protein